MRTDEIRGAGTVVGSTLAELTVLTRDVHRAVAGRVFGLLGVPGAPVRIGHRALSEFVYACVQAGVRYGPQLAALGIEGNGTSVHDDARSRRRLAAITGALGSRAVQDAPALDQPLRLHPAADARPTTGRIVIFLHGLCESDASWQANSEQICYGSSLADEAGWTPLYAAYNSGRHVSASGGELSLRAEELIRDWPVPVAELALVGHSMGGLVARSACHQAVAEDYSWPALLSTVVMLGTPHFGAPLERAVNRGTHLLARLPETRPVADLLNQRSAGIKDLRHGALLERDWLTHAPEDPDDHCEPVELLPGVSYYNVAATLTRRIDSPLTPLLGDLLVQARDAIGEHPTRRIAFAAEACRHIGRANHFHLLNSPAVYTHLRRWLA
jgi:pimeloyl-ACP methyl ester carboxylesterase